MLDVKAFQTHLDFGGIYSGYGCIKDSERSSKTYYISYRVDNSALYNDYWVVNKPKRLCNVLIMVLALHNDSMSLCKGDSIRWIFLRLWNSWFTLWNHNSDDYSNWYSSLRSCWIEEVGQRWWSNIERLIWLFSKNKTNIFARCLPIFRIVLWYKDNEPIRCYQLSKRKMQQNEQVSKSGRQLSFSQSEYTIRRIFLRPIRWW